MSREGKSLTRRFFPANYPQAQQELLEQDSAEQEGDSRGDALVPIRGIFASERFAGDDPFHNFRGAVADFQADHIAPALFQR